MLRTDDTIAAIATAPGGAARGIVRMSGGHIWECLAACFQPAAAETVGETGHPRSISGSLCLENMASLLPCQLLLWPTTRSYTREPVAELHTIGSPPLLQAVLDRVCDSGARVAEPGEFTLRAFLAGRLDLTQAEAVLSVIDASDRKQLDAALAQLAGGITEPLTILRDQLLDLLAQVEASLDFSEEDIAPLAREKLDQNLTQARETVTYLTERVTERTDVGEATRVVLIGCPNVGKSSLFNAILGQPRVITSNQSGTTRDYVTASLNFSGIPCQLVDTAGLETAARGTELSRATQEMTLAQQTRAQVAVLCIDSTRPLLAAERSLLETTPESDQVVVLTKTDAVSATDISGLAIKTSSHTGKGLADLRLAIGRKVLRSRKSGPSAESTVLIATTAARCRQNLHQTAASLTRAHRLVATDMGDELIAAELSLALTELGKTVGAVYTDNLLDRIFGQFCIGK